MLSNVVKTLPSTVKTIEGRRLASPPDSITVAVLRLVRELVRSLRERWQQGGGQLFQARSWGSPDSWAHSFVVELGLRGQVSVLVGGVWYR